MKEQNPKTFSRRNFLGTVGAATAAFTVVPSHVMAGRGYKQPSDTVNVAGIGVGARGGSVINSISDPEVETFRKFNRDGTPYSKEEIAEREARMAERQAEQEEEPPRRLANIYALCDVDENYAAHMFEAYPKAKVYTDWREMLEKEPSIDAVASKRPTRRRPRTPPTV